MRKTTISALLMSTLMAISILAIGSITIAEAKHWAAPEYPDVYWTTAVPKSVYGLIFNYTYQGKTYYNASLATTATQLYGWSLPNRRGAVFAVAANITSTDDPIVTVDLILPQNQTQFALFHLVDTEVVDTLGRKATSWTSQVLEVDARGWIRSYRFMTSDVTYGIQPKGPYQILYFCLYFDEGPSECNYMFTVWTHDSMQESHSHYLWLSMDKTAPRIITYPKSGDTVNGRLAPCGRHYFTLNVTVIDDIPSAMGVVHDTGIKNATIVIYNATNANDIVYSPPPFVLNLNPGRPWMFIANISMTGRPSGGYNLTVNAWDGVGNKRTVTVKFTYIAPPAPLTIRPSSGHAAPRTEIINAVSGLVKSYPETYKNKVLGTLVTIEGREFGASLPVSIRVYIPTYHSYNAAYGTYNVLVNQTTTRADGTFTATFVFPKAPAGIYNVSATTSVMECAIFFEVKPEVIYEPDEVMGPALITVKATGFTAQNTTRPSWLFIVPEALQAVNLQVDRNWYIDGNGTLQNRLNDYGMLCDPPETIENTLYWPFAEPGTYTVEIKHVDGDYWNGRNRIWVHIPCFVGSNIITVKDWTGEILNAAQNAANAANAAKTAAEGAKSSADAAKSSADAAKSSADAAKSSADAAKSAADAAKSSADAATSAANAAKSAADAAKSSADAAKSSADSAKSSADSAKGYAQSAAEGVDGAKKAAEGLTIPVYLAVVFSLIAAIIAAACAVLVYRKIA